jgi:hypothetical protein
VVSPDGSKLLFDARLAPHGRYGLTIRDLARGAERFIPFPFPQAGDVFGYAWSPDSRRVALIRGAITDNETFPTQLFLLDFDASGRSLIYAVEGIQVSTWWFGGRAPVKVSQFAAVK